MTDIKPKGTFAKLMSSSPTPIQNTDEANLQNTRKPENQNSGIPVIDNKQPQYPEIQKTVFPENQKLLKRETYTKATYRLCDDALDAIEHAKRYLRRQYKIKVNLEEIAEEAIIHACKDLFSNKENSRLVASFSGKPENQNVGKPENNNS